MKNKTIFITLANGAEREWDSTEYDSYEVNENLFVVEKDEAWIGIYPINQIRSIEVY